MKPKVKNEKKRKGVIQIALSGDLTLKYHKELSSIFNSIDVTSEVIELRLDQPSAIDLSFLQMLAAYRTERKRKGKLLYVSALLSEADEKLISRTGFSPLLSDHEPVNNYVL